VLEKTCPGNAPLHFGFREKDEEGKNRSWKWLRIAAEGGVPLIGPNANGFYCPASKSALSRALMVGGLPVEAANSPSFLRALFCRLYLPDPAGKNIRFSK